MKQARLLALLISFGFFSFKGAEGLRNCYTSFRGDGTNSAGAPEQLLETSKARMVMTESGQVPISQLNCYKLQYTNDKGAAFVNVKVITLDPKEYNTDKQNLLANLRYMNSHSKAMESSDVRELRKNGYLVYGISRNSVETGNSILGTYVMFPDDSTAIYFYFNNADAPVRSFHDVDEYKT